MVDKMSGTPDEEPTVLDIINDMIQEAEAVTDDNATYLEELLSPKTQGWGGIGGKMDQLSQAPEKLQRSSETLIYLADTMKFIRDSAVADQVDNQSGTPDEGPTVLEVINKMIKMAEAVTGDNVQYMQELLKPKKWWGGRGQKLEQLSQAPVMLGRSADTLAYLAETLKVVRDNALEVHE
jgi:hypothetical protein